MHMRIYTARCLTSILYSHLQPSCFTRKQTYSTLATGVRWKRKKFCPSFKQSGGIFGNGTVLGLITSRFASRYALSHLHNKCRCQIILEYFNEEPSAARVTGTCCDVRERKPAVTVNSTRKSYHLSSELQWLYQKVERCVYVHVVYVCAYVHVCMCVHVYVKHPYRLLSGSGG